MEGISVRDGGEISYVVEINCSQFKADFILKIYPDQFHWKMEKEVFVYQLLSKNVAIPSPKILLSDDSKTLLSRNYVLSDDHRPHSQEPNGQFLRTNRCGHAIW